MRIGGCSLEPFAVAFGDKVGSHLLSLQKSKENRLIRYPPLEC